MTIAKTETSELGGGAGGVKNGNEAKGEVKIDETLYSRQLYVLGQEASRRMASASVLICGLGGVGVEVAKNIILMGVKSVTLYDAKKTTLHDLSTQFFLREADVGQGRARACLERLRQLNTNVRVEVVTGPLAPPLLARHSVVVLTDSPLEEQERVNKWCRDAGRPALVVAATRGLCGQIFCDFGERFEVLEPKTKSLAQFPIANVTNEKEGLVTLPPKTFHGLRNSDLVVFSSVLGMTQLNDPQPHVVKVVSGNSFRVGDTSSLGHYEGGGECQEVQLPITIAFMPLPEALDHAPILAAEDLKEQQALMLHVAFMALHEYEARHGHPPRPWHAHDANVFLKIFHEVNEQRTRKAEDDECLIRLFAYTAAGQTAPMTSIVGGVAAQEVAKACSAKFPPLQQWLYLDAMECLPQDISGLAQEVTAAHHLPSDRYLAQTALFGPCFQDKLGDSRYFVVGAGAIGCELLKILALEGVGAGQHGVGEVIITDMDVIEKSNLSRQFLFGPSDVMQPKSVMAAAAAVDINPDLRVKTHQQRVGPDSEQVFNADFYARLDGVLLALDNVEARRYMDHMCWLHRKPMMDSGTLGTSGSVQPIVPGLTERYAQEQVADDHPLPMCTLRRFPTTIHHTLQWARDQFEGEFTAVPEATVRYLSGDGSPPDPNMKVSLCQALLEAPQSYEDCVTWARSLWQEQYYDSIVDLLKQFPPDLVTSSGTAFWSSGKRRPQPLTFQPSDNLHLDYVHAVANLRAAVYGLQQERSHDRTREVVEAVDVAPRDSRQSPLAGVYMTEDKNEDKRKEEEGKIDLPLSAAFSQMCHLSQTEITEDDKRKEEGDGGQETFLPPQASFSNLHLTPQIFEKDNDDNFHIDFITAASNLRAINYGIAPIDRMNSKRIAGRIIPAIVTSTAVAAGLAALEMLKVAQGHTHLRAYRTTEFNLAVCRFCMAEPAPPEDTGNGQWSEDFLEVEGELTMAQFLTLFRDTHHLDVTLVAAGKLTLHSFLLSKEERAKRANMTISAIMEEVGNLDQVALGSVLMLEVAAEDMEGGDVEVPPVRYFVRGSHEE